MILANDIICELDIAIRKSQNSELKIIMAKLIKFLIGANNDIKLYSGIL
jgi:hypothetical protein